jgi:hypothetical protein
LDNGIEIGRVASSDYLVVLSLGLQGGDLEEITVAYGIPAAEKVANALLREVAWLRKMERARKNDDWCDVELAYVD